MAGLVVDDRREEQHRLDEAGVDARQELGGDVEGGVLVLRQERHDLAHRCLHGIGESFEAVPRDVLRGVPLLGLRLLVEAGDVVGPDVGLGVEREGVGRHARLGDRTPRDEAVVGGGHLRHVADPALEPVPQVDPPAVAAGQRDPPVGLLPGGGRGPLPHQPGPVSSGVETGDDLAAVEAAPSADLVREAVVAPGHLEDVALVDAGQRVADHQQNGPGIETRCVHRGGGSDPDEIEVAQIALRKHYFREHSKPPSITERNSYVAVMRDRYMDGDGVERGGGPVGECTIFFGCPGVIMAPHHPKKLQGGEEETS